MTLKIAVVFHPGGPLIFLPITTDINTERKEDSPKCKYLVTRKRQEQEVS